MAIRACTIIARNYLAAARVLARSFFGQHPDGTFEVLIIDDRLGTVDPVVEEFEVLSLDDVGIGADEALKMAAIYDVMELATAVKPWLLQRLLDDHGQEAIYLDPDIQVFGSLDAVADLARRHDVVLTPHVTRPIPRDGRSVTESQILAAGIYNLGFLAVGQSSGPLLHFWRERLYRECIVDPTGMRFVDQRWLDFAPGLFDAHILRDPEYNVAYWNLDHRTVTFAEGQYLVDGRPLAFFHFSGYSPHAPELLSKHQGSNPRILLSRQPAVARLCDEYGRALLANGYDECSKTPYGYGEAAPGVGVDRVIRRLYRRALLDAESAGTEPPPNPLAASSRSSCLSWLNSPADGHRTSRYVTELIDLRADLKEAFRDPDGADFERVMGWVREEARLGRLDSRLVPDSPADEPEEEKAGAPESPGAPTALVPGVRVAGYLRAETGVGESGRLAARAIEAAGITCGSYTDAGTVARQRHPWTGRGRDDLNVNLVCVNADELPRFAERVGPGFFAGRYTIGMWAWELSDFPARYDGAFDLVDEVWMPSTFAAEAVRARSPKPVLTFPLPVVEPRPAPGFDRTKLGIPERYVFLFCLDLLSVAERKNPLGLVEAFQRAFPTEAADGPVLVVKALNGHLRVADLERLRLAAAARSDVVVLDEYLTAEENAGLTATCDCYVSLHRSEGLGLTIAEAMALGKPVVCTAYSGNMDFTTEETAYLVPWSPVGVPPGADPYPVGTPWAEPDLDAAASLMRHVYEHPDEASAVGRRARAEMLSRKLPAAAFIRERFAHAQRELARADDLAPVGAGVPAGAAEPEPAGEQQPAVQPLTARALERPAVGSPARWRHITPFYRRLVLRLLRHHDEHQRDMNVSLALGIEHLARVVAELQQSVAALEGAQARSAGAMAAESTAQTAATTGLASAIGSTLESLEAHARRIRRLEGVENRLAGMHDRDDELERSLDVVKREAEFAGERIDELVRHLADLRHEADEWRAVPYMSDPAMFSQRDDEGRPTIGYRERTAGAGAGGYAGFEDTFRGPEELVRDRQRFYLPFLLDHGPVVDLGCGRGELLEILRDEGVPATGVDVDQAMIARCRKKDLEVVEGDALQFLDRQPVASVGAVFSAQFVEHVEFETLRRLLASAYVALRPGGLLIMETVNPHANHAFKTFWTDPTHRAPIFPEVLLSHCREAGFPEATVVFPNGTGDVQRDRWAQGEYAVLARKH